MQTIGVCINWVVGGGPPCELPIGNGTCIGNNSILLLILATLLPLPVSLQTWVMGQRTLNLRTLRMNLMYSHCSMFVHMCNLLYDFFGNFFCPCLPPVAAGLVSGAHGKACQILKASCRIEISPKNHTTNCLMRTIITTMY